MRNLLVILIVLVLGGAAFIGLEGLRFAHRPVSDRSDQLLFEVSPGESFHQVASRLANLNLVSNKRKFLILGRINQAATNIRIGEYELRYNMSPMEILNILKSGISAKRVLTIPEGYNRYEIAQLFQEAGLGKSDDYLKITEDKALIRELLQQDLSSLEGYLYPETYYFTKFSGAREVVKTQVKRFLEQFESVKGTPPLPLDRHQVVILASMIEKETGAPEERPTIASVFFNRLVKNMKLQSDPTTLYGILDLTKVMKKNITKQDLLTPTRYNTYTVPALPYGPIANPGKEALSSVFRPAQTNYLFFVSRNDGTHIFSENLQGHNQAVQKFQMNAKARQGKSWRDLKKREVKKAN